MHDICSIIGFDHVDNLGTYLVMLLFHGRVGKQNFEFIIDKVRRKLSGWDVKRLSMAGRITLVKSVYLVTL